MYFVTDTAMCLIHDLERVKSCDELFTYMESVLPALNVRYFSFYEPEKTAGTEIKGVHIHNLPAEWLQRYLEMHYDSVSPVLRKMMSTMSPFFWNTLEREGYFDTKATRRMWSEGSEFGLADGFTYPILHANGDMVLFNLATDRFDGDPKLAPTIQLLALHLHGKFKELRGLDRMMPLPKLTSRERECLAWAAAGKTNWEIGEILSISEASVRTYIKRAMQKLGATAKVQAIVTASRLHLIPA
jgi:DNA-binding CsgD family transcriptional regulator